MAKGALSNQLLNKEIEPKPEFGNPHERNDVNAKIWANFKPTPEKVWRARIDAAWTEEGSVKILAHDCWGNIGELWLTQVNLKII